MQTPDPKLNDIDQIRQTGCVSLDNGMQWLCVKNFSTPDEHLRLVLIDASKGWKHYRYDHQGYRAVDIPRDHGFIEFEEQSVVIHRMNKRKPVLRYSPDGRDAMGTPRIKAEILNLDI